MRPERSSDDSFLTARRRFLLGSGMGLGSLALAALLGDGARAQDAAEVAARGPGGPHFLPRARRVIWLFMAGGPSQMDLFDPKPELRRRDGEEAPDELLRGRRFAFLTGRPRLLGSPFGFAPAGESGLLLSELLPMTAGIADRIGVVHSMHTDHFNHGPAQILMNTGHTLAGRPSAGSWALYGLGTENANLPGFCVLVSGKIDPGAGASCWSSGFLPTRFQGVPLRGLGDPVPSVANPLAIDAAARRRSIDLANDLNRRRLDAVGDPEISTRIAAMELAFRMQTSVPELADLDSEPEEVHRLYGTEPGVVSFANNCLMARRLVERGVRFVQLYHRGWDHHGTDATDDIGSGLPALCRQTDRAAAALVVDLERRGLLEDTLVVWGGEFGRTPMREVRGEGRFLGRDHQPQAFTIWMAGGGLRPGFRHGATDPFGSTVVESPVHVNDLHATMLHLLGLDHRRLTYRHQGRDFRLTDVAGELQTSWIA